MTVITAFQNYFQKRIKKVERNRPLKTLIYKNHEEVLVKKRLCLPSYGRGRCIEFDV